MHRDITQITKTSLVAFSGGEFVAPAEHGMLFRCSEAGNIQVQYLNDPEGTHRTIPLSGINEWLPDRILKIIEAGTTVSVASITVGYN